MSDKKLTVQRRKDGNLVMNHALKDADGAVLCGATRDSGVPINPLLQYPACPVCMEELHTHLFSVEYKLNVFTKLAKIQEKFIKENAPEEILTEAIVLMFDGLLTETPRGSVGEVTM